MFEVIRKYPSTIGVIGVNLMPVVGVVGWGWSAKDVVLTYLMELAIVGCINFLKLLFNKHPASGSETMEVNGRTEVVGTRGLALFFLVHYGFFVFGYCVFTFTRFHIGLSDIQRVLITLVPFCVSHGYSFIANYLTHERFSVASSALMFQPYVRIIPMHLAIIFGMPLTILSDGSEVVIVLVAIKTVIDVLSHVFERFKSSRGEDIPVGVPGFKSGI